MFTVLVLKGTSNKTLFFKVFKTLLLHFFTLAFEMFVDVISNVNVKKCSKSVLNTLKKPFRRNINNKKSKLTEY